jgi:hypothetical protein
MRLTDWIVNAVEAHMQQQIVIPDDVHFSDLNLGRDPDGGVSFAWSAIEQICEASDLPIEVFRDAPEDNVSGLIVRWYLAHRQHGGDPDPVAEDLIAETAAEEQAGQHYSHTPGRA